MDDLAGFLVAALALTASPGPANLTLAACGVAFGVRRGLALVAGLLVGIVIVMVMTATGFAALVLASPMLGTALEFAAAAYIAWLAWRIATAPPLSARPADARPPSFGTGLFLSLANPKSYVAMAALFSGFVLVPGRPVTDGATKLLILVAIIPFVALAWLALGSALTRLFHDPRASRVINVTFAVLLVASVAYALMR